MSDRLRPDYTRSVTLQDILNCYDSAEDALAAGAPYAALVKALQAGNATLAAAARIMCGVIPQELPTLAPDQENIRALLHWCHDEIEPLRNTSATGKNWEYLKLLLGKPAINILILCGPLTRHGLPKAPIPGFRVETAVLGPKDAPSSLENLLPTGFQPDVIFILDIYGSRIPENLYEIDGPIIFFNMDSDFQLPHQHQDLMRADLIICNSLHEHRQLTGIYPCPVLALTANAISFDPVNFSEAEDEKIIDLMHSGLSFTPMMREKAQFLFRLATIDEPSLNIRFHHGFMKNEAYRSAIRNARYVPVFSARMTGGIQTRSMDTLCNGGALLLGGNDAAVELFGPILDQVFVTDTKTLEESIILNSKVEMEKKHYTSSKTNIKCELAKLFQPAGGTAARLLKFGLFEWARTGYQRLGRPVPRTTGVSRLSDCLALARSDDVDSLAYFTLAHFRTIEAVIAQPFESEKRSRVQNVFDEVQMRGHSSLAIYFNQGRYLWLIGDKQEATAQFTKLVKNGGKLAYDPTRDPVMLNLFEAGSEMFPAQDYFMALAEGMAKDVADDAGARNIIIATALTYLALRKLQLGDLDTGLKHLTQALDLFHNHFPAARLRYKALHASNSPYPELSSAFDHAVKCYPPVLTDLLPYAVSTELNKDRGKEALSLIKMWAYFITRCTWEASTEPEVPKATFKSVRALYSKLPKHLQVALAKRFPAEFGSV